MGLFDNWIAPWNLDDVHRQNVENSRALDREDIMVRGKMRGKSNAEIDAAVRRAGLDSPRLSSAAVGGLIDRAVRGAAGNVSRRMPRPLSPLETLANLQALRPKAPDTDARVAQMRANYQQILDQFNSGPDPLAVQNRDAAVQELDNMARSAYASSDMAYGQGIASTLRYADEARAAGARQADAVASLYRDAASQIGASTGAVAQAADARYGHLGAGTSAAVTGGAAADIQAAVAAAAPREAALAQALAQSAAQAQQGFASSMDTQRLANNAQMQRDAAAYKSGIYSDFAKAESERQAREQAAYLDVLSQMVGAEESVRNEAAMLNYQAALDDYGVMRDLGLNMAVEDYVSRQARAAQRGTRADLEGVGDVPVVAYGEDGEVQRGVVPADSARVLVAQFEAGRSALAADPSLSPTDLLGGLSDTDLQVLRHYYGKDPLQVLGVY